MIADPRFADREARIAHAAEMREELLKTFATADARTWENRLAAAGVPAGAVLTIPQMASDEQVIQRGLLREGPAPGGLDGTFRTVGAPFRVRDAAGGPLAPTPGLGEHTDAVLGEAGFATDEIQAFRASGAVA